MEEIGQSEIYKAKGFNPFILSVGFLALVILSTVGLFAYNSYLSSQNLSYEDQIKQKQDAIKSKKSNSLIQVYDLYSKNKSVISKLEKQSGIVDFINHLDEISIKYAIELNGFDYSAGEIKTTALATGDSGNSIGSVSSYKRTYDFIKKYRADKQTLFNLGFIDSFTSNKATSGNDEQIFPLVFKLK